jgi:hypothetical protein
MIVTEGSAYKMEEWAASTTVGRRIFNYNYRMTDTTLKGWELVNVVEAENEPGLTEKIYIWEKTGSKGKTLVRVGISEHNDWRLAQAQLQRHLMNSMRQNIPRGSGKLAKIGDVIFAGQPRDAKVVAATFFTRGNVTVTVSSVGETVIDISDIVRMLDRALNETPSKQEIEKGLAEELAPRSFKAMKGETVKIIDKLPEPVARSGWIKIITPDGELRREDDSVVYISPQAGEKKVEQYRIVQ